MYCIKRKKDEKIMFNVWVLHRWGYMNVYDRNTSIRLDHDIVAMLIFLFWRLLVSLWPLYCSYTVDPRSRNCWIVSLICGVVPVLYWLYSWGGICVSAVHKNILWNSATNTSSGQYDWKWLCTRRSQHLPYGRGAWIISIYG